MVYNIKDIEEIGLWKKNINFKDKDVNKAINFIKEVIRINPINLRDYEKVLKKLSSKYKFMPSKSLLSKTYQILLENKKIERNLNLEKFTRNKQIRSNSGIIVVTLVMKPDKFSCPFDCYMCPDERIDNGAKVDMPRSYLSTEPAEMRAQEVDFDPVLQFINRMDTLKYNNHELDKVEVIILGGTFSTYPRDYQKEFIRDIFYAANTYFEDKRERETLLNEQYINESSKCHIVGLSLETRPDQINKSEIKRFREYGATKIQLGVQHTEDHLLDKINRKHSSHTSIQAIKQLKTVGFKIEIHIMPDLPDATPEIDILMMDKIFKTELYQPDYIKIYPCLDVKFTKIREWKKNGIWKPYAEENSGNELFRVLIYALKSIPYWMREGRIQRDFPLEHKNNNFIGFVSKNIKTNLYQLMINQLKKENIECRSIRNREVKNKLDTITNYKLFIEKYNASEGIEYFISYETKDRKILYGFLRLRFNNLHSNIYHILENSSIIRELHIYGSLIPVDKSYNSGVQHFGFGKKLLKFAEYLSYKNGYRKIAVISAVGTRDYYRKFNYNLIDTYMVKDLNFINYIYNYAIDFIFILIPIIIILVYLNNKLL